MTDAILNVGGVDVSRETFEKLEYFCALIQKWTKSINLIAPTTVPFIWDRHIVDSAQIFLLAPVGWQVWTDLGSGGGLPAVVVAILDQECRPITLIESDQRKCLFLKTARRELELNIEVVNARIEAANVTKSDVLSARALAPLQALLPFANQHLMPSGTALFAKGARFQEELDDAAEAWQFDLTAHISKTNPDSRILELSRISRRES